MKTLQQTGSMISISIVARDDDGTLQRLFDILTILASQMLTWINIQLADPSHAQGIQVGILVDRLILLATLLIDVSSRFISLFEAIDSAINDSLDWCAEFYIESCRLWQDVGFLFTGRLQVA